MKPNKEQQRAIETINKNIGVVAGAGTGKTKILTNRFIHILESSDNPDEDIEKILAITFTVKATAEMVDRIEKEILKLSKTNPRFKSLINKIPYLKISTIDSFCKRIVDENYLYLGINPDYRIIDDRESDEILTKIIVDIIESNNSDLLNNYYINNLMLRSNSLVDRIMYVYKTSVSKGYNFDDLLDLNLFNSFKIDYNSYYLKLSDFFEEQKRLKTLNRRTKIFKNYEDGLYDVLTYDSDEKYVVLEEILDGLSKLRSKKTIDTDYVNILCDETYKCLIFNEKDDYIYYEFFNKLLKEIHTEYTKKKLNDGTFEFIDLVYLTREVFKNNELLRIYQNEFKYIMIDEYQDTNKLQRDIFYSLSTIETTLDRNNFFVVGDPKQSIYAFRGSDVKVFDETLEDIIKSGGEIIKLVKNYRSSEEMVNYTNNLFKVLMGNKYDSLEFTRDIENRKVEFINLSEDEKTEAEAIALKILELKDSGKTFGDIVVLFRQSTHLSKLEDRLNEYNIPYVNSKSRNFYNKTEIKDLILFLKFINNKNDSLSLYGLLRSKIFSLSDADLYKISKLSEASLWESLNLYDGDNINILKPRNILSEMLSLKDKIGLYEFISKFINDTHYIEILSLLSNSSQEIENIILFTNIVLEFENENSSRIFDLLDYILFDTDNNQGEASIFSEDAVNLMTIHGSKGLEFNTVILYDSDSTRNPDKNNFVVNGEYGYGLKTREDSKYLKFIKEKNSEDDYEEFLRLLYVCLTRAEERFIFFSNKNIEKSISSSYYSKLLVDNNPDFSEINEIKPYDLKVKKLKKVVSDNSYKKDLYIKEYEMPRGSFSSFSTFKKSKRDYFYKYKLGLNDFQPSEEKIEYENNIDSLDYEEKELDIDPSLYGTVVHEIIENYSSDKNKEELIDSILEKNSVEKKQLLVDKINRHISSYINSFDKSTKKFHEFQFLLKLKEGYISGSIDQLEIKDDDFIITDFKTNKTNNIGYLIDYYKPQILLYNLAIKEILGKYPKSSFLYFLDIDKKVEIEVLENEIESLKNELNSFLRFIKLNDSIDKYE